MTVSRIFLTVLSVSAFGLHAGAQDSIERVLGEVEANNLTLRARAELAEAGRLEARTGNSLPDPQMEYEHLWGSGGAGRQGEFSAVQPFDFPSAYASRNRLARLRGEKYSSEYGLFRQELLMEAQNTCIEIIALRRHRALLEMRARFAGELAAAADRMLEEGRTNILQASEAHVQHLAAGNATGMLDVEIADALGRLKILNGGEAIEFTDGEFPPASRLTPFSEMAALYADGDPEILGAAAGCDAARQEVRTSRSASLPRFALGYKLAHGNGEQFHGVVAGMSIPMFGNRNNVRRAMAQERYASLEAEEVRSRAEQRLSTLYAKAAMLEESIRRQEEITEDTGAYLDNLRKALETGRISITDYFSQYDGIMTFEEALIELEKEYHLVRARIYSVTL